MLNKRKFKILYKKNSVQSNVKVGKWKCSGMTSRNVLDTVGDLVGNVERKARGPWIRQEMISKID